jgi:hypothetical protein
LRSGEEEQIKFSTARFNVLAPAQKLEAQTRGVLCLKKERLLNAGESSRYKNLGIGT